MAARFLRRYHLPQQTTAVQEQMLNLLVDARQPLLEGILDYDAAIGIGDTSMKQAVSAYREAVAAPHGWAVGRFIWPSSRLEALVGLLTSTMVPGERPWQVGVVVDEALGTAAMHTSVFHTYMDPAGAVTSVEPIADNGLSLSAESLVTAVSGISPSAIAYAGLQDMADSHQIVALAELAHRRVHPAGALLTLDHLPHDPSQLAALVMASAQNGVPLKIRCSLPPDAMLLQLLTAAALAHRDGAIARPVDVLEDPPGTVTATAVGLRWRDELFGVPDIKKARTTIHSWNCGDLIAAQSQLATLGLP